VGASVGAAWQPQRTRQAKRPNVTEFLNEIPVGFIVRASPLSAVASPLYARLSAAEDSLVLTLDRRNDGAAILVHTPPNSYA
jgi:hypothetical protein